MKIPFVGPSATARSLNVDAERSVNCFLELDQSNPPRPAALYGTPGLLLRATLGTTPVRGACKLGGYVYWVAGNQVFRMDTAYAVTTLAGTIGTSTGRVAMAADTGEILLVDGVAGWLISGTTLTQVVDVDFPNGVTSVTYQDGYFIVCGDGSQRLYWNETPNTGSAWNGTDFASAEGSPDNTVGCISDHRELWLFGSESAEIWVNSGDSAQLFQRSGNTFIEQGTAAAATVRAMNNSIYWLGSGKQGQGIVFSAQGYNPVRVSDHELETAIAGYSTIADAFAFCMEIQGHSFYVLTFPTADATWLYDAATQKWTDWLWRNPATNELHRHRAGCCIFFNGEHLVGDWESGKVYGLSMTTYDDAGDPILRLRRTQTQAEGGVRLFFGQISIDMETGVGLTIGQGSDPQLMLRYSDDGGHTWSNYKTKSMGATGEYGRQVRYGPTGAGRNRVWEISTTDPVKWVITGANVDVTKGTS